LVAATTDGFFFIVSSSEESDEDEESFFFFVIEVGGAIVAFFAAGVTEAFVGVAGGCFLFAGGATSSESELELLDGAALRFRSTFAGVVTFGLICGFFSSSSDDSEEDDDSFFFLFPLLNVDTGETCCYTRESICAVIIDQ